MTRRPNKRASSEYAPGPRSPSAAESRTRSTKTRLSDGRPMRRALAADIHTANDRRGVRKPMVRKLDVNKVAANRMW